ncbi:zinc C2H2 type family protein, putative [Ichthyophthirius multifiliis]|uniref:Zinc C2H2 type family protein, putative n=1 Tax=Ichthyophthirius multifiliis TaxID=5932 RepID=G0QYL6_ICHMU|nr:zinc C2H2 type family protein, putative [Ichthyophthirius multifiliis]EGR29690.1 zinc C2H2 type family protein, putative [Ichthyophthirius multifiliis]|eukprot:XP_004030926.1 zinc C2H2 type family protein, putative [Ichthyophthirius multifiliis]
MAQNHQVFTLKLVNPNGKSKRVKNLEINVVHFLYLPQVQNNFFLQMLQAKKTQENLTLVPLINIIMRLQQNVLIVTERKQIKLKIKQQQNSFKPEALAHHQKACTPSNPFKPLPPQNGGDGQMSEFPEENDAASLKPCVYCGRKFASDRIAKHESVCNKSDGSQKLKTPVKGLNEVKQQSTGSTIRMPHSDQKSNSNFNSGGGGGNSASSYNSPVKQIVRPKTLVCYICGREFGTASLQIHIKTCEQKWDIEQSKLPKKDRRPCPKPPQNINQLGGMNANDIQNYNNQAFDAYNNDALIPCKFCNRTFTQTALEHHKKVCTAERPFKPLNRPQQEQKQQQQQQPQQQQQKQQQQYQQQQQEYGVPKGAYDLSKESGEQYEQELELVPCGKCGRNFASERISKHEKVCKGPTEKKVVIEPPKVEKKKQQGDPLWKKQHEEFIESMKYMKKMKKIQEQGGDIRQLPPPKAANTDHLIPCPYCNRKFNDQAAEKHIPACKNTINKPKSVAQSAPNTFKMMQQNSGQQQMQQKQQYGGLQQKQQGGGQQQQYGQQIFGGGHQQYGGTQQQLGQQQKLGGTSQQQFKLKK